jgi:hypothetical protein
VFVDETGVNMNKKDDGNPGGGLFIVPSDDPDTQLQGATTEIYFRVLCFQADNGQWGTNPLCCCNEIRKGCPRYSIELETWHQHHDKIGGFKSR